MRFLSTRAHGILDYVMGAFLIIMPWLFGFAAGGAATWVPILLGAGVILYSLFTDYELGAVKGIAMPTHLWLDILGGALLAVSPWLFDFNEYVYLPHLILGIVEIGLALVTDRVPYRNVRYATPTEDARLRDAHSSRITSVRDEDSLRPADRAPMPAEEEQRAQRDRERERRRNDL